MLEIAFAVPGCLDAPTGGYGYARKLLALAPGFGVNLTPVRLPDGFPQVPRAVLPDRMNHPGGPALDV